MHHVCMYAWQNEQQHDVLTTQICTTKKIASTGASVLAVQHHGPGPTHQATFCGVLVGNVAMQIRSSQCDLNCIAHHRGPPIFVAADLVNATTLTANPTPQTATPTIIAGAGEQQAKFPPSQLMPCLPALTARLVLRLEHSQIAVNPPQCCAPAPSLKPWASWFIHQPCWRQPGPTVNPR